MNRLAGETSPYLRQHRDNPVDWYPWGPEAFAAAESADKPILLSVGYSACHWCHVMAHESFEDDDVAKEMNRLFVCVKVDREERPDVDAIYMEAVQSVSGHGGWPMTVFLTPDGKPFFGGTYYPKPGFLQLLAAIDDAWHNRRPELLDQAGQLTESLNRLAKLTAGAGELPGTDVLNAALQALAAEFDTEWGGFGRAPKFPQAMTLELCLRAHAHNGGEGARTVVTTSLDAMASGGMYDHLGGGFARYSVDAFWMVPHFEKMLYDQALLSRVYLHAWLQLGEPRWRQVLDETIGYVLRDLRQPEGGFSSAEDADSEGEEGRFYVWRREEIEQVLGPELAPAAIEWYGVTKSGNFEGSNILHRPVRGELARPPEVEVARQRLFDARETRVRPGLDDKVLTEWNALMLDALSRAAAATQRADWLEAAVANGEFLLQHLRRDDGRWLRSWQRDGGARHLAFAADYAALVGAFVSLAQATGQRRWIDAAVATADAMLDLFWDPADGGLFTTGSDGEALVTRAKDLLDNATPAANSMAALGLLRLAALTGDQRYREHAERVLALLGPLAGSHPLAFPELLSAVDFHQSGSTEIAVVGDRSDLVAAAQARYLPNAVLAWGEPYPSPLWEGRRDGFAYVCRDYACLAPVDTVQALEAQLTTS
ncbi:MAG: thioredoxin domain-containing protein [Actinobacteria bacterium]|nr:MAG: thioredoxin domain-containing protein [Actinomycetota bacterium]